MKICDSAIPDCWTYDIADNGDMPLECVWEYLELVRLFSRPCGQGESDIQLFLNNAIRELAVPIANGRPQPFTPDDLEKEATRRLSEEASGIAQKSPEEMKKICGAGAWPSMHQRVLSIEAKGTIKALLANPQHSVKCSLL